MRLLDARDYRAGGDPMTQEHAAAAEAVLALERAALDRWAAGDPSGFLAISATDVTYFDPFLDRRLDGIGGLSRYYEALRGKIRIDRYETLNPRVEVLGDVAVLTFNYVSWNGPAASRWKRTESYRRTPSGWRIFQTHWSRTGAGSPSLGAPDER
jgi:ketosteroid isomerase-like protein